MFDNLLTIVVLLGVLIVICFLTSLINRRRDGSFPKDTRRPVNSNVQPDYGSRHVKKPNQLIKGRQYVLVFADGNYPDRRFEVVEEPHWRKSIDGNSSYVISVRYFDQEYDADAPHEWLLLSIVGVVPYSSDGMYTTTLYLRTT